MNKNIRNNIHFSHARPKTKASGQPVGIADHKGASLEENDNHTTNLYTCTTYSYTYMNMHGMFVYKHMSMTVTYI